MRQAARRAGLLVVVLAIFLGACGGSSELTVDDLAGTWRSDVPSYVRFDPDGSYSIALSIDGLANSPVEAGKFTLWGTVFTFVSSEGSSACPAGDYGTYELETLEHGASGEDRIEMIFMSDECGRRGSVGDVTIERVP